MSSIRVLRLPYRSQRGQGIGSVFKKFTNILRPLYTAILKKATPVVKNSLKRLGTETVKEGVGLISDLASGANLKEAAKGRLKAGLKKGKDIVLDEISSSIKAKQEGGRRLKRVKKHQGGSGKKVKQRGGSSKRKKKRQKKKEVSFIFS